MHRWKHFHVPFFLFLWNWQATWLHLHQYSAKYKEPNSVPIHNTISKPFRANIFPSVHCFLVIFSKHKFPTNKDLCLTEENAAVPNLSCACPLDTPVFSRLWNPKNKTWETLVLVNTKRPNFLQLFPVLQPIIGSQGNRGRALHSGGLGATETTQISHHQFHTVVSQIGC
jgi:hypothetical protein